MTIGIPFFSHSVTRVICHIHNLTAFFAIHRHTFLTPREPQSKSAAPVYIGAHPHLPLKHADKVKTPLKRLLHLVHLPPESVVLTSQRINRHPRRSLCRALTAECRGACTSPGALLGRGRTLKRLLPVAAVVGRGKVDFRT